MMAEVFQHLNTEDYNDYCYQLIIATFCALILYFLMKKENRVFFIMYRDTTKIMGEGMGQLILNVFIFLREMMPIGKGYLRYTDCHVERGVLKVKCNNLISCIFFWFATLIINTFGFGLKIISNEAPKVSYVLWLPGRIDDAKLLPKLMKGNADFGVSFWNLIINYDELNDLSRITIKVDLSDAKQIDNNLGWLNIDNEEWLEIRSN